MVNVLQLAAGQSDTLLSSTLIFDWNVTRLYYLGLFVLIWRCELIRLFCLKLLSIFGLLIELKWARVTGSSRLLFFLFFWFAIFSARPTRPAKGSLIRPFLGLKRGTFAILGLRLGPWAPFSRHYRGISISIWINEILLLWIPSVELGLLKLVLRANIEEFFWFL
jgi:hypothetical protein